METAAPAQAPATLQEEYHSLSDPVLAGIPISEQDQLRVADLINQYNQEARVGTHATNDANVAAPETTAAEASAADQTPADSSTPGAFEDAPFTPTMNVDPDGDPLPLRTPMANLPGTTSVPAADQGAAPEDIAPESAPAPAGGSETESVLDNLDQEIADRRAGIGRNDTTEPAVEVIDETHTPLSSSIVGIDEPAQPTPAPTGDAVAPSGRVLGFVPNEGLSDRPAPAPATGAPELPVGTEAVDPESPVHVPGQADPTATPAPVDVDPTADPAPGEGGGDNTPPPTPEFHASADLLQNLEAARNAYADALAHRGRVSFASLFKGVGRKANVEKTRQAYETAMQAISTARDEFGAQHNLDVAGEVRAAELDESLEMIMATETRREQLAEGNWLTQKFYNAWETNGRRKWWNPARYFGTRGITLAAVSIPVGIAVGALTGGLGWGAMGAVAAVLAARGAVRGAASGVVSTKSGNGRTVAEMNGDAQEARFKDWNRSGNFQFNRSTRVMQEQANSTVWKNRRRLGRAAFIGAVAGLAGGGAAHVLGLDQVIGDAVDRVGARIGGFIDNLRGGTTTPNLGSVVEAATPTAPVQPEAALPQLNVTEFQVDQGLLGDNQYIWGSYADRFGADKAASEILSRIDVLRANGWTVNTWGDPNGTFGVSSITEPDQFIAHADGTITHLTAHTFTDAADKVGALEAALQYGNGASVVSEADIASAVTVNPVVGPTGYGTGAGVTSAINPATGPALGSPSGGTLASSLYDAGNHPGMAYQTGSAPGVTPVDAAQPQGPSGAEQAAARDRSWFNQENVTSQQAHDAAVAALTAEGKPVTNDSIAQWMTSEEGRRALKML